MYSEMCKTLCVALELSDADKYRLCTQCVAPAGV